MIVPVISCSAYIISLFLVLLSGCTDSSNQTKSNVINNAIDDFSASTPSASPTNTAIPTLTSTVTPLAIATPVPTADIEPSEGMFEPWFEAYTSVAYSSGLDSEWAYGNQRKEFTASKACYVRISNSVVAPWHWGYVYGYGNKIVVTYRFTGTSDCQVDVADGFLTKVETDDPNITEFTRIIEAKAVKEDNNVVVFQYTPSGIGSVSLEIVYDHQVKSKYDVRSTIYFVDSDW